jgi:Transposase DDE domain
LKPTRIDYCQFLLSSHTNFTITHYAEHTRNFSHDAINRYLRRDKMTGSMIWEHVKGDVIASPQGCIVFDDSILDKNHSHRIELVRRQYSGNAHGLIKGIGMVNCLYVNPETGQYWVIDFRLFDPEGDGKSKLDHVQDMLDLLCSSRSLAFNRVLVDSWYATKELMLYIEALGKIYYCPLKDNRQVDDSGGERKFNRADSLLWNHLELEHGKIVKIKGFPKDHKVKLFRVAVSTNRTDFVATNDLSQNTTKGTQDACALRWKIEQFHREIKQVTGIEKCQCRSGRIQRNHIACAVLVWNRLTQLARSAGSNIYQLKKSLLSDYLRQELRSPTISMAFA